MSKVKEKDLHVTRTEPQTITVTHVYNGEVDFGEPKTADLLDEVLAKQAPIDWLRDNLPAEKVDEFIRRYAGSRFRVPKIGAVDHVARNRDMRARFHDLRSMGINFQDTLRTLASENLLSRSRVKQIVTGQPLAQE